VSLGASATFQVAVTGATPFSYQWRLDESVLSGATNRFLVLTNVQLADTGGYSVVVADLSGSVTSKVAALEVDATFTKITAGNIVNDGGFSQSAAWGDYDEDGFIDLFVANWGSPEGGNGGGFLYHNERNGTFTRILSRPPVETTEWITSASWGDYDNDGFNDLYVTTASYFHNGGNDAPNRLYHNNGDGTFTLLSQISLARQPQGSFAGVWGDVNNDGWLDLFVGNIATVTPSQARDDILYLNDAQGDFKRISFGTKALNADFCFSASWADFDNDGWPDLVISKGGRPARQRASLYHNNRDGTLTLVTNSIISASLLHGEGCAWGDYDNDGWPDLCIGNFDGEKTSLFHNNGDGTFTKITNSIVVLDGGNTKGVAWADYDNDGWLDLFVSNLGPFDPVSGASVGRALNFLYHNNGDGTFTKITSGSLANDLGNCGGAAWGDYNNDGFLDLFVANGFFVESANNLLYRNNGNSNSWLNIRLIGRISNRSAIGAKIRVKATIHGKTFWQMREISGGSSFGSQNDMRANFGLGDATVAGVVRVEWPSGIVQTMTNVPAKQFLTIVEHQEQSSAPPKFTNISSSGNGVFDLSLTGEAGLLYLLEASTNLIHWQKLAVWTNSIPTMQFTDISSFSKRFYRVSAP
jgi:hypothetical protein